MDGLMDGHEIVIEDGGRVLSRIYVGNELAGAGRCLAGFPVVYAVYDRNVERLAADLLSSLAGQGIRIADSYPLSATEEEKCMDTVAGICRWLMEKGADRNALLLAVGGGITTDIAGFAASVYKRGIRFAYLPTTLLAQVDAAIGGKTGVNLDSYKNMIGVIRQPEFTWLCPEVLSTLDYRTFLSGAAEMLKTFIISDGGWYGRAVRFLSEIHDFIHGEGHDGMGIGTSCGYSANSWHCDAAARYHDFINSKKTELAGLIAAAAAVKARIVSADQFERGERRKLNLGHTFAHAIEWYERRMVKTENSGTAETGGIRDGNAAGFSHGEAVAVGIILAARLSEASGVAPAGLEERLKADFIACGLPVDCPFPLAELTGAMTRDKKAEAGKIHFILIKGIGEVTECDMTAVKAAEYIR